MERFGHFELKNCGERDGGRYGRNSVSVEEISQFLAFFIHLIFCHITLDSNYLVLIK